MPDQWIVAYRCHHVDHMDVTLEYYEDGVKAVADFANIKTFTNLKFVRLEKNGEAIAYFRPDRPAASLIG